MQDVQAAVRKPSYVEHTGGQETGRSEDGTIQILQRLLSEGDTRAIADLLTSYGHSYRVCGPVCAQDAKTLSRFYLKYYILLIKEAMRAGLLIEDLEEQGVSIVRFYDMPDTESRLALVMDGTKALLPVIRHREGGSENGHILRAKEFIRQKIADPELDLGTVSGYIGLSRIYFCKLFHESEGVTFNTYLKNLRIAEAKRLLSEGAMKAVEVSRTCGYANANYFGYVFKHEVGMTPLEFQRRFAGRTK